MHLLVAVTKTSLTGLEKWLTCTGNVGASTHTHVPSLFMYKFKSNSEVASFSHLLCTIQLSLECIGPLELKGGPSFYT